MCEQQFVEKNKRGHFVQGVTPIEFDLRSLYIMMYKFAENAGVPVPIKIWNDVMQIDIDKLTLFMSIKPFQRRQMRLKQLKKYDMKIVKSLRKRSMNLKQYESIYNNN